MQSQLVMTVISTDRPGIVESVSRVISDHQGNWLESRMARLAGRFAGILLVEVDSERSTALMDALRQLHNDGLTITVEEASSTAAKSTPRRVLLELVGNDHPGIVHQVTERIAAQGVNIEDLTTTVSTSPMSGTPMFTARAVLEIPDGQLSSQVQVALEDIAADIMVDISLNDDQ
jgi:glycine cleavage system regulatory protein